MFLYLILNTPNIRTAKRSHTTQNRIHNRVNFGQPHERGAFEMREKYNSIRFQPLICGTNNSSNNSNNANNKRNEKKTSNVRSQALNIPQSIKLHKFIQIAFFSFPPFILLTISPLNQPPVLYNIRFHINLTIIYLHQHSIYRPRWCSPASHRSAAMQWNKIFRRAAQKKKWKTNEKENDQFEKVSHDR